MPNFDHLEIRINPSLPTYWTQGRGICVAEIYINNEPLIELVRQVEEPFVRAEIEESDFSRYLFVEVLRQEAEGRRQKEIEERRKEKD